MAPAALAALKGEDRWWRRSPPPGPPDALSDDGVAAPRLGRLRYPPSRPRRPAAELPGAGSFGNEGISGELLVAGLDRLNRGSPVALQRRLRGSSFQRCLGARRSRSSTQPRASAPMPTRDLAEVLETDPYLASEYSEVDLSSRLPAFLHPETASSQRLSEALIRGFLALAAREAEEEQTFYQEAAVMEVAPEVPEYVASDDCTIRGEASYETSVSLTQSCFSAGY
eukprot:TRINITY_DN50985_c0_g1_i1.p1 TRINITY_DN50985_c0_g1~~TRINITY_DN50985_c0_g1_i1.p1  ORF type:complete len:251 (-),score=51.39 TRINITY_DN50985_c0_g1_i1:50-727(-)